MCKVCKEFLTSKAASLGKTANTAVHDFDLESDDQENDEDNSDNDSNDESLEEVEGESSLNEATNTAENLVSKVKAWRRFEGSVS